MKIKTGKPTVNMDLEGNMAITFPVDKSHKTAVKNFVNELPAMKDILSVEVKEFRKNRSLNANNYFWKMCGELAEVLNLNPVEVYRNYIVDMGVCKQIEINEKAVPTLIHSWGLHGIGWIAEKVDRGQHEGFELVNLYYGSSVFNTKQMSRLIDAVVQDCKEQGIETMSPAELESLKGAWKSEKQKS